jgi:hypothetical protein
MKITKIALKKGECIIDWIDLESVGENRGQETSKDKTNERFNSAWLNLKKYFDLVKIPIEEHERLHIRSITIKPKYIKKTEDYIDEITISASRTIPDIHRPKIETIPLLSESEFPAGMKEDVKILCDCAIEYLARKRKKFDEDPKIDFNTPQNNVVPIAETLKDGTNG